MAEVSTYAAFIHALRIAMDGLGFKPSIFALDTPLATPRKHKGFAFDARDFVNTKNFRDRDCSEVELRAVIQLQHKLRPGANDQIDDLISAGDGVLNVIGGLMGNQELNALGHLGFSKAPTRRDRTAEWLTSDVTITLRVEVSWALDGE